MKKNSKTHCINGHKFTKSTIYTDPSGTRHCRICRKADYSSRREYLVPAKWCDHCKFPIKTHEFKCSECGGSLRLERDHPKIELVGWSAIIGDEDVREKGALAICNKIKSYVMTHRNDRAVAIWYGKEIFATVRGFANNRITINVNEKHKQWKQLAPTLQEAMQMVGLKATA